MFWGFLLAAALAAVLVKLGALSVWVSVLHLALMLALLALACMTIAVVWRRLRNKAQQ